MGGQGTELRLKVRSNLFETADDRSQRQAKALVGELQDTAGRVEFEVEPVSGTRGGALSIIVGLGSAGMFTTVVELLRSWTSRHDATTVEVSFRDGEVESMKITGGIVDRDDKRRLTAALLRRLER